MQTPLLRLRRLLLLALALGTGYTARAQVIPQPLAVTGFNADIVANGSGNTTASSSSNSSVDANSYVFHSNDYVTTTAPGFFHPNAGLPFGQTFLGAGTATPAVQYRLQPYGGNNSLRLYGAGGTASPVASAVGTLTLTTPTAAGTLYVLASSGSGSDVTTAVVNFADGTNQPFSFTVQDWFSGTPYAYPVSNRVLITGTNFDAITSNQTALNPRLYQYALALSAANASKNITSVTFTKSTSTSSYVQIMALSAAPAVATNYTPMALAFPATGTPAPNSGSGFTSPTSSGQDVITNGLSGNTITAGTTTTPYTNTSATADTDGAGYFLTATDYNKNSAAHDTYGLPVAGINGATTSGLLTSLITSGLTYQLADYSSINALQIRGTGSGGVSFTPTAATEVYVLTTSTNSGTVTGGVATVLFSDGTSHSYSVSYTNWFTSVSSTATQTSAGVSSGVYAKGRLQPGNTVQASTSTPYLFENKLLLDPSEYGKTIKGVTFTTPAAFSAGVLSVLGVTLNSNTATVPQCVAASGHSATSSVAMACAGTTFNLNVLGLKAAVGYSYQWQYSADNATWSNLTTSTAASPYSTSPTTAACPVTNQTAATYYRCLVQCSYDQAGTSLPSASVQVGQTDPINCFPYPTASPSGCSAAGSITAVKIAETATATTVMNKTGLSCGTTTEPYNTYGIYRDANSNGTLDKAKDYTLTVTATNSTRIGVWLDLNRDGVFNSTANSAGAPTGEYFGTTNTTSSTGGTLTISIPATALATVTNGVAGLRVRTESGSASILSTAANSNAATTYGVTLDYAVIVTGATPCSGTPTATAPTASTSTACPGTTFTLAAQGPAVGTTGLSYQWQYKLSAGGTYAAVPASFTDVNGNTVATNQGTATLTIVNQRASTDYRVIITCTNSNLSATSPATTVGQSALANCYCQNANNATNEYITNVTLGSINNTTGSSQGNTPTGFADYTASPTATQTTTVNRNGTYTISVTALSASSAPTEMVWIDYDQSGTFDPSEYTLIGTQATTGSVTGTKSITIPATALLGDTRMRVRFHNDATGTSASACTNAWNGETEDYRITIGPELACAGTPPTTTASSSASTVCGGTSFTLSATGIAAGTTGLTYQWQSSPAGAGTFSNISGATTNPYTVSSQTTATDYRLVVTCTNSNLSSNSNTVSVAQNNFLNCYCQPSSSSVGDYLSNVTLGTINNSSGNSVSSTPSGYTDYTASPSATQTTDLGRGTSFPVTITAVDNRAGSTGVLWIDYDHSGTFDATNSAGVTEYLLIGTGPTSGTFPQTLTFTNTLAVPASALLGPTHLRVRWHNDATTASDACTLGWNGETEEYLVNITVPSGCTGTPATATASASASSVCGGTSFTLSATGINTTVGGLTYQWQSSPAGAGTFSNISGATTNPYTVASQTAATDYRLVVTCTNSNLSSNSNTVSVAQNSFLNCYCTPVTTGTGTDGITKVVLTTPAGTLTNSSSATNASPYYTDYSATQTAGTLPIPTLYVNGTATLAVTMGSDPHQFSGAWIDFDHSGTFDTGEFFTAGTDAGANGTSTFTITVPASALSGQTKMRVRGGDDVVLLNTQSCTASSSSSNYGEVEDYLVTIAAPVACTGTPPAITASASASSTCAGASFTLSATGIAAGTTGLTYQWQSSPAGAGTFTDLSGATTNPYTVSSQSAATDYRLVVTCTASSQSSTSNVVSVGQNSFTNCYCTPTGGNCTNEYVRGVTLNTLSNTGTTCTSGGYADYTGNAALTTTLAPGSNYSITLDLRINSNPAAAGVWIDYDHSGTFDASEFTQVYSNTTLTGSQDVSGTVTLAIPASALTGTTRLRVRSANSSVPLSASGACTNNFYGEVEDYLITIAAPDLVISTTGQTVAAGTYNSITVQSGGQGTLAGNVTVVSNVTVQSGGTLNDGCAVISGAGTFTLAAGGTLGICNTSGIMSTGASGAVQVTGTRTFSTDASYVYNGTAAQSTGSGLPSQVRNLTTTNNSDVTLTGPTSATQVVTVGGSGNLALNGQALTLLSSASGTALIVNSNTGLVTGATGVAQRYLATSNLGNGYRQYSAPVSGSTVADLATSGFSPTVNPAYNTSATPATVRPFPTVYGYDQSRLASTTNNLTPFNKGWYSPASTGTPLAVGQGYTVQLAGNQLVDFVGTFTSGSQPVSLSRGPSADAGLALVGNPYPAPMDWSLLNQFTDRPGVDGAFWVFASSGPYAGSYRSYVNGQGSGSVIPMGQGFFVRVSAGQSSASLTFRNAHRLTSPDATAMQRTTIDLRPRVTLELRNPAGGLDQLIAYAEAGATVGLDAQHDASKLSNPTGLNLSSTAASGEALAIDGRPAFVAGTELPLQVGVPAAGSYSLAATELENLPAGLTAYLRDAATGQTLPLTVGQGYSFSVTATQAAALVSGRFTLVFRSTGVLAATPSALAAAVSLYPNPAGKAGFTVGVPAVAGASQVQAELLNTLGQVVARQATALPATGATLTFPTSELAAGVYVLRLTAGAATATKRVVIE